MTPPHGSQQQAIAVPSRSVFTSVFWLHTQVPANSQHIAVWTVGRHVMARNGFLTAVGVTGEPGQAPTFIPTPGQLQPVTGDVGMRLSEPIEVIAYHNGDVAASVRLEPDPQGPRAFVTIPVGTRAFAPGDLLAIFARSTTSRPTANISLTVDLEVTYKD